jgi:hypothetical protein
MLYGEEKGAVAMEKDLAISDRNWDNASIRADKGGGDL